MLKRVAIQWIVENVEESAKFYSKQLGFTVDYLGDGPLFAIVSRDNFSVMLRTSTKWFKAAKSYTVY